MTLEFWSPEDQVGIKSGYDREMVEALPNGGYVVAWRGSNEKKVYFQIYNGAGQKVGGAHSLVSDGSFQNIVDIQAIGTDGRFAISWNDSVSDQAGSFSIKSRVFDVNGNALGGPETVQGNLTITAQETPAMARYEDTGFVTAYSTGGSVYLAVQGLDGKKTDPNPLLIASGTNGNVDVVAVSGNEFVVSYVVGTGGSAKVHTKVVTLGSSAPAMSTVVGDGRDADVVALKNRSGILTGAYAVTTQFGKSVKTVFYNADGTTDGQPFEITDVGLDEFDYVHATALRGGRVAVVYSATAGSGSSKDNGDIFLKIIDPTGSGSTVTFPVPINSRSAIDGSGQQYTPTVTELSDGRLAIAWHDPTYPGGATISTVIVDPRLVEVPNNGAARITGTNGDDIYAGSDYSINFLNGLGGNDKFFAGRGADRFDGGTDTDLVSYERSTSGVVANLGGTGVGGFAQGDTYANVENLLGSIYADTLIGNAGANVLNGGAGDDVLIGGAGADALVGEGGTDTVDYSGSTLGGVIVNLASGVGAGGDAQGDTYSGIENVVGTNFADVFYGGVGANVLVGGGGDDTYYVDSADIVIEAAGSGTDTVITTGNYTLGANIEALTGTGSAALSLTGNALNNTITGNAAGNWIDGGEGADTMIGGAGDDIYVIDNAGDVIIDTEGNNTVLLKTAYDLSKLPSSVSVSIADGINTPLTGTNGANVLRGNAAANILKGQGGNDTIYGMLGNDRLYGGTGKDVFVFDTALHKTRNVDKIYDFKSKDDSCWLDNKVFTKLGKGTPEKPQKFKSGMFYEGKKAHDKDDRIIYDKKTGALYYDKDGTGSSAQVKFATITNKTKLYYHDFLVI